MRMLLNCLWIAGAGAIGALARFGVGRVLNWPAFPLGTLLINVSGSFLLGWLYAAFQEPTPANESWRLAIGIGFLGAFTTFSSFMYESDRMLNDAEWIRAASYLAGSVFLGLIAVRLGVNLGRSM